MKSRRKLNINASPKIKQKHIIIYAVAGSLLAILVGTGLFFYFNVGNSIDSFAKKNGNGYTSSGTGNWSETTIWEKSAAWMNDTPGENINTSYVDLNGHITRIGNLSVEGSTILTVYDTLRITGNIYVSQGANLVVESGGVLIVEGDFITDGGGDTKNNAIVIVLGNFNASGGAELNNNNNFYLFGTPSSSGGAKFNGEKNIPANANFLNEQDLISGNSSLYAFATGTSTLPITLSYFKASVQEERGILLWQTISEVNNDYFTIERSKDGKQFHVIGTIKGVGNSNKVLDYEFIDSKPLTGQSFYRLKQTDFDGQFEYFDIVTVHHDSKIGLDQDLSIVNFGPNPFQYSFSVEFDIPESGEVTLKLTDINGALIASRKEQAYAGMNKISFQETHPIKNGTYLVTLIHPKYQSKPIKLIKN